MLLQENQENKEKPWHEAQGYLLQPVYLGAFSMATAV
jgi:hypothetical protein